MSEVSNAHNGRALAYPIKTWIFTVLDAKNGFHQVTLDDASSQLTTFSTPFGCF